MKRQLIFLFLFILLTEVSMSYSSSERVDLIDLLELDQKSLKYIDVKDTLKDFKNLTFSLEINSNSHSELKGYISLKPNYLITKRWVIIKGEDTAYTNMSSSVYLQLNQGENAKIIFSLDEIDLSIENGLGIQFIPAELFEQERFRLYISQAVFAGILVFLFFFNLILSYITLWKVYFRYAIYILSALLYMLYYFGFLQEHLIDPSYLSVNLVSILYPLVFTIYFWFILSLGDYKNSSPKADYFLKIGIGYQLIQILIELIFYAFDIYIHKNPFYKYPFLAFEIALMGLIIYHIVKSSNLRGKLVIGGSSLLIIAAILAQFDTGYDRAYILEVGILSELLLFSLGLGYISKEYYRQKNISQQLYLNELEKNDLIQKEMQKNLEKKVEKRTAQLTAKNRQNEALLKEVNHRVKNNLQFISSMLQLQLRRMSSEEQKAEISKALLRIKTIGLIHEHLYQDENILEIDLKSYVNELCRMISSLHKNQKCEFKIHLPDMEIAMDKAIVLGIILNELFMNSLKYANIESGILKLNLEIERNNGDIIVEMSDNGIQDRKEFVKGFGYLIIENLVGDSDNINVRKEQNGFYVRILM